MVILSKDFRSVVRHSPEPSEVSPWSSVIPPVLTHPLRLCRSPPSEPRESRFQVLPARCQAIGTEPRAASLEPPTTTSPLSLVSQAPVK